MIIVKHLADLEDFIRCQSAFGRTIGFVPTMGALHQGHIALLNASLQQTEITVCSIFINPTQFNDAADYRKYPVKLEEDIYLVEKTGTDVLFIPAVAEVYPQGADNLEHYELGYLETTLEGKYRPGHFQGVCQVMNRLLTMVKPHKLFMGQKDFQQCMVVEKLLSEHHPAIALIRYPTVRETDGLAMSSRNLRLTEQERQTAPYIYKTMLYMRSAITPETDLPELKAGASQMLTERGFRVDYIEIADAANLEPVSKAEGKPLVILVAAFLNEVRLIDNMLVNG